MHHLYNACVGTADRWPYLILLQAVPALLSLVVLPFLPETPRYLLLVLRDRESAVKGRAYCVQGVRSFSSSMAFPVLGGGVISSRRRPRGDRPNLFYTDRL